jgi:hypothetical protein
MKKGGKGCIECCEMKCLYEVVVKWRMKFWKEIKNGDIKLIDNYINGLN